MLTVALALHGGAAWAEMCFGEYQVPARRATPAELRLHADELDRARQREAERLRQEEAAAEQHRAELAARRAARPAGERLLEARCISCHDINTVRAARHGAPGWALTLLRMRVINGARLPLDEARVLHEHLIRTQPADRVKAVAEWAVVALASAVAGWTLLRRAFGQLRRR